MSSISYGLHEEIKGVPGKINVKNVMNILMYRGYAGHYDDPVPLARAYAAAELFRGHHKHIYNNDMIAGSLYGLFDWQPETMDPIKGLADETVANYGMNNFKTGVDHFTPDYETLLSIGIDGHLDKIGETRKKLMSGQISAEDKSHIKLLSGQISADGETEKRLIFLKSAEVTLLAFGDMIGQYGEAAYEMSDQADNERQKDNLLRIAKTCERIKRRPPETFHEALQLIWLTHTAFLYEGRYAMALGRMDQYLYPFYRDDIARNRLSDDLALEMLKCVFYKIGERAWSGGDDVVNICVGGVDRNGDDAVNELSFIIVKAVMQCQIPGPNLSARISPHTSDEFLDACLQSIGTGLGYPALMNDMVNIPALHRYGYSIEDCRDYCMVGCIENFIAGKQPPWSDGRYNTPKYIELAINDGVCMLTGAQMGPKTGGVETFATMERFLDAVKEQMIYGAARYIAMFRNDSDRYDKVHYSQPFLSCFCRDCLERGLDINDGGALYPSAHGACCMGIGTFADSLAAVGQIVFTDAIASFDDLRRALLANFGGYDELRAASLRAPKYGNGDDRADRYAVWFVEETDRIFSKYRTRDGGAIYTAIAANTANIEAGRQMAASPDGRLAGDAVSDAASPTYGMDKSGPTAVVSSVTKPDYTLVACGTVLNQKYSPDMFNDPEKRKKLLSLIKVYFQKGGQEMQINAISRQEMADAMENPERHQDLIVRVSGFSARFVTLAQDVQMDILRRTEHE